MQGSAPRAEKVVSEHQVLSVAEAPQRPPRRLEPALLDKVRVQREPPLLVQAALLEPRAGGHLVDHLADALDLAGLQRRVKHEALEIVQLVRGEEAVLVGVDEAEDAREGVHAGGFQDVLARVVQRGGRVEDGVLREEEDFGDVEGKQRRAFDAGLGRGEVLGSVSGSGPRGRSAAGTGAHLDLFELLHDWDDFWGRAQRVSASV